MNQYVVLAFALWLLLQGLGAVGVANRTVTLVIGWALVVFAGLAVLVGFLPALQNGIETVQGMVG